MTVRPRRSLLNSELQRPSALSSTPRDPKRLWLDKNENLDPELMVLTHDVLSSIPQDALATYPEAGDLYRKLALWVGVSADSLLLTPGSDGAIRLVFEGFVEDGDGVIHTSPTFAMYPVYSKMFGAMVRQIEYAATDNGPFLNPSMIFDELRKHKPKLLCLPNPDSPTGTTLPAETLREILVACESVGTVLLVDEAYHPFHDSSVVSSTQLSANLIVARTFAKAWGVAGLRIGYAVGHPQTIALLHKLRPMYETSTLAVEFMCRMLDHSAAMMQSVARINDAKHFFENEMRSLDFKVLKTGGNFTHVAFGERSKDVHATLSGKVLYRASFDHPCLSGYSRFSVAPQRSMARVVDLIRNSATRP